MGGSEAPRVCLASLPVAREARLTALATEVNWEASDITFSYKNISIYTYIYRFGFLNILTAFRCFALQVRTPLELWEPGLSCTLMVMGVA